MTSSWVRLLLPFIFSQLKIDRNHQQTSEQVCFGGGHGLFGIIPTAPLLPGKMIAYFFIKKFFKCDCDHYSNHGRQKGRAGGVPSPPLDFEIISKKRLFFQFRGVKQISLLLAPSWKKFWENPLLVPPGKIPSDAHDSNVAFGKARITLWRKIVLCL